MADTVEAIVKSTHLPLSIVILGIGNADFRNMSKLDGDGPEGLTDRRGNKSQRDIVQFIKVWYMSPVLTTRTLFSLFLCMLLCLWSHHLLS